MKTAVLHFYALTIGVTAALLAACGGSQPLAGNPVPLPATAPDTSYLYVGNDAGSSGGEVDILNANDPKKGVVDRIVKGVFGPDGIFVDTHGTLYVANAGLSGGTNGVVAYRKGARKPFRTYAGAFCAFDVIAADDGTVYIADACGGSSTDGRVLVYPPGRSKPSRSIYVDGAPYCLTLDAHNNLYVGFNAEYTYWGQVERFAPGASRGLKLIPKNTVYFLSDIAVDSHGALLVTNAADAAIDVFTAKNQPPTRIIKTGQARPFMFAFDQTEKQLYVTYPCRPGGGSARPLTSSGCGKLNNTLVALDYASGKRLWTLQVQMGSRGHWLPFGVALYPKAPF